MSGTAVYFFRKKGRLFFTETNAEKLIHPTRKPKTRGGENKGFMLFLLQPF